MKLADFMDTYGITEHGMVALLKKRARYAIAQPTINRIKLGKRTLSLGCAVAIETATDGEVRIEDLPLSPASRKALNRLHRIRS